MFRISKVDVSRIVRPSRQRAAKRCRRELGLWVEALELRQVPAGLDMTQVAIMAHAHHDGPTRLDLNFDGGKNGDVSPFNDGANTEQDIQDILFRTAEIFAPFNEQV